MEASNRWAAVAQPRGEAASQVSPRLTPPGQSRAAGGSGGQRGGAEKRVSCGRQGRQRDRTRAREVWGEEEAGSKPPPACLA